jgi:hypothetical protein
MRARQITSGARIFAPGDVIQTREGPVRVLREAAASDYVRYDVLPVGAEEDPPTPPPLTRWERLAAWWRSLWLRVRALFSRPVL